MLFEHCCDENNIDLEREEIRAVCAMIAGGKPTTADASSLVPGFSFDVVANSKHGIDVDKLDYIQRDVLHLNLPLGFDHKRLIRFSKVVGDDICFHRKEVYSVYHLVSGRSPGRRRRAGRAGSDPCVWCWLVSVFDAVPTAPHRLQPSHGAEPGRHDYGRVPRRRPDARDK
jgi:hypothetical protein